MNRTPYMQKIMWETHPELFAEAALRGFVGCWERLIAKKLFEECILGSSEASDIVDSIPSPPSQSYLKAAYLITSSKIQKHEASSNI